MKLAWAIAGGLTLGIGTAWWLSHDASDRERARQSQARETAGEDVPASTPALYRWRDSAGVLHVTQTAPKGQRYERVERMPRDGIEVHGDRR